MSIFVIDDDVFTDIDDVIGAVKFDVYEKVDSIFIYINTYEDDSVTMHSTFEEAFDVSTDNMRSIGVPYLYSDSYGRIEK